MIRAALLVLLLATRLTGGVDWYGLTPDEMAARPEARQRIDPEEFDAPLLAAALFAETNRVRARLGLPRLKHLERLDAAADLKAAAGVLEPELSHTSALPFSRTPADRVTSVGLNFARVAENLARVPAYDLPADTRQLGVRDRRGRTEFYRLDTGAVVEMQTYAAFAAATVESWMASPGHRANIVNPELTHLGCAARRCQSVVARHEQIYAVQVFFTPLRP